MTCRILGKDSFTNLITKFTSLQLTAKPKKCFSAKLVSNARFFCDSTKRISIEKATSAAPLQDKDRCCNFTWGCIWKKFPAIHVTRNSPTSGIYVENHQQNHNTELSSMVQLKCCNVCDGCEKVGTKLTMKRHKKGSHGLKNLKCDFCEDIQKQVNLNRAFENTSSRNVKYAESNEPKLKCRIICPENTTNLQMQGLTWGESFLDKLYWATIARILVTSERNFLLKNWV